MPWIKVIDEEKAEGELKEIYREIREKRGKIANIVKIHSLNPSAMKAHIDLYITLMFGKSGLSRVEREMIAVVVSTLNECEYCVNHHKEALYHYWKDGERVNKFIKNFKSVPLPEKTVKMLIVSYFNFVYRIASGLGVEYTEEEIKGYRF